MTNKEFVLSRYPKAIKYAHYYWKYIISSHRVGGDEEIPVIAAGNTPDEAWANAAEAIRKMEAENVR